MILQKNKNGTCYFGAREITEDEYNAISAIIKNRPTAPSGYAYHLTDALEWELVELEHVEESATESYTQEALEAMTNAELESILRELGVSASMNKANMVTIILALQERGIAGNGG